MNKTKIEYLDFSWNPIAMLCDPVSPGCQNCWHRKRAKMLSRNPQIPFYDQMAYSGQSLPRLIPSRLKDPYQRKKPSIIGVQFMGDIFHPDVGIIMLDAIFDQVRNCPQHTFLFLTKRIDRAKEILHPTEYLKNMWLGVSVEDQKTADERIPILLQIPAAVRFVSVEPMLEGIDFRNGRFWIDSRRQYAIDVGMSHMGTDNPTIDWVIAGPETGPRARPCPEGAIENLYDQCRAAGVPFFDKRKNYLAREFPR